MEAELTASLNKLKQQEAAMGGLLGLNPENDALAGLHANIVEARELTESSLLALQVRAVTQTSCMPRN